MLSSDMNTMLSDELADIDDYRTNTNRATNYWAKIRKNLKYCYFVAKESPFKFVRPLLIFGFFCGAGIALITFKETAYQTEQEETALDLAVETGRWFSDELDRAILPLFSMALFVSELEIFHGLPDLIGPANEPGSLPFLTPRTPDTPRTHRNVTGVCDDPTLINRFTEIASTIKSQAGMEGVLVNIQLAPQAVVCLLHPMVNTEDFSEGIEMDNSGAWGHDLLTDPARKFIAEVTIPSEDIVIAGPLTLRQCADCDATVKKAFIARLAIDMKGHEIVVNDVSYEKWGFAVALINWEALIDRSGVYEKFEERGLEFQLTRTDRVVDQETQIMTEKVVVLAETSTFHQDLEMVSTPLKTTNNEWVMTVAYENEEYPTWKVWSIVATVVGSFLISTLYFTIMIQKVSFENVKKKYREDITQPPKLRLRSFLEETTTRTTNSETSADVQQVVNAAPVADLFPATTVLFSDVVGFSAWSSEREPTQVFTLLQTLFHAFDKVGKKHDVFNVHTTFHCYVGVTGFPIPQPDHALRMVKFARECMVLATKLTQSLEKSLGPGTGDLCVRFGLHSGPVTAGVMYGDRARLQLFGDTMSTGARILSSGEGGRIHLSQATADLIAESGKRRCLETRQGMVSITGNGDEVQTYWLKDRHISAERFNGISSASRSVCRDALESSSLSACSDCDSDLWGDEELGAFREADHVDGEKRLIEWHVDWMARLLKDIIARRNKRKAKHTTKQSGAKVFCPSDSQIQHGETPLDEVLEVIILPAFDPSSVPTNSEIEAVEIREEVISQLRELVTEISKLYRGNPFHNFEHASHVTMSVHKLLHRIVVPDQVAYDRRSAKTVAADLHDYTFGITSDPLTHFAVVFSALVHDVDHTGLTNGQLANENPDLAGTYKNKSIAEQNSVDIAWERLMVPRFKDLQDCLFGDESELLRFRQIIVNVVLATDIFDKELKALRNLRWDKAFHPEKYAEESCLDLSENSSVLSPSSRPSRRQSLTTTTDRENLREKHLEISLKLRGTNRRATIVIEHIIQASDVSHTMQHWHIYTKWNELLFQEMFAAWKTGRSDKDPSEGWYKGEIWFFDNYVIPLAKKLAECGVFGVASDECLHNALENRKEWAVKGGQIVADMSERANNTLLGWERKISSRELVIPMVAEEEDFDDLSDEEVVS